MKERSNLRNIIIAAALIIAVGVAGYLYTTRDRSADELLVEDFIATSTNSVDSDLLATLRQLRKLKLDDSIFTSAAWLSLTDFGKVIPPQQPGRSNPFAPLDASSFAATSTAQ
ncbi:MAG TPA: hypothetical protein VHD69_00325 [Candidatus Paceibacterota bacterium]|nr:hypothetical protein [Candidatus Paceibacterota bacterium]